MGTLSSNVAMLSLVSMNALASNRFLMSTAKISVLPPGLSGYRSFAYTQAVNAVPTAMLPLNESLTDGSLVSSDLSKPPGCLIWTTPLALPLSFTPRTTDSSPS